MSLLESIKQSAAQVMTQASYVRLNEARLADYGQTLLSQKYEAPFYDPSYHYLGGEADMAAYLICLDSINFGSGYFPYLKKRPGMSGYFTVAKSLKDWFDTAIPGADNLARLRLTDCAEIFGQALEHHKNKELLAHFTKALNDLGLLLIETYGASFSALIESANQKAETLMGLLSEMDYFKDFSVYKGLPVPIYKRAQILPSDLYLALEGKGLGYFQDIDQLTIFADNLVPHVLRVDGVLSYSPDLLELIKEPLAAGSEAEVEIRCAAIHAVERIVQLLRGQGIQTSARILDMLIWNRGLDEWYRQSPRHRTYSVFY